MHTPNREQEARSPSAFAAALASCSALRCADRLGRDAIDLMQGEFHGLKSSPFLARSFRT